jgi:tRNA-dihydrouridine synthase B
MDGVSDAAFRAIVAKHGRPSLVITEFTSVEGLRAGATRLLDDFIFSENERPVIAQLFGADPEAFFLGAVVASSLGFDGIDINMGCPAKNVTSHGAGASLILDPLRAQKIVSEAKRGTAAWANGITLVEASISPEMQAEIMKRNPNPVRRALPVSVKTRVGYDKPIVSEWIPKLLETNPAAISLHGRTLKQLYTGLADWDAIAIAKRLAGDTILLGNGDVKSIDDASARIRTYGVDGVLIGRAAFGNPWIFQGREASQEERLRTALEHSQIFSSIFPPQAFVRMRKHLFDYCRGFDGASELRAKLTKVSNLSEVEAVIIPLLT